MGENGVKDFHCQNNRCRAVIGQSDGAFVYFTFDSNLKRITGKNLCVFFDIDKKLWRAAAKQIYITCGECERQTPWFQREKVVNDYVGKVDSYE